MWEAFGWDRMSPLQWMLFPGREFRALLKTIYPSLEEKTRSLQLEAVLTNADQSLKPGLFARVTLYTGRREARSSPDHGTAL